jgi:nitronate monooxygenase
MTLPAGFAGHLSLPVIGAPMFIVSQPTLVIAQCLSGVIGAFPALNARPAALLDTWLKEITETLDAARAADSARLVAPFAVNQIVHPSNARLEQDLELCVKYRVPLVITSLSAPGRLVQRIHDYGGLVFHDVISVRHAQKALSEGVDGLILVCAGAGGHAGTLNPFAFVSAVRRFWDGPLALSGAIADGRAIRASEVMGADFAYMGTRFLATQEAHASTAYKDALVDAEAADIVNTPYFTGVAGNYLKSSIVAAGLDPDRLPLRDKSVMDFAAVEAAGPKPWRDIWGAGQSVSGIQDVPTVAELVKRLKEEYFSATMSGFTWPSSSVGRAED